MALMIEVTKKSVVLSMPKQWCITLSVVLKEDGVPVFEGSVSEDYKPGYDITEIGKSLKDKVQNIIDKYKSEKQLFDNAILDTVVADIQGGLNGVN